MEMLAFKTGLPLLSLNPKDAPQSQHVDFLILSKSLGRRKCVSLKRRCVLGQFHKRTRAGGYAALHAVSVGIKDTEVSTSEYEDFSVTTCGATDSNELKISVNVSGAKTEEIFDKVFSRMVEDAQPIPGFRRVKGGKTPNDVPISWISECPCSSNRNSLSIFTSILDFFDISSANIPRDILLEILGYSKVYKQVIKKIINSTISEYVGKEGLTVSKDLQIEQSFEDLEAIFEPGDPFTYSAIIQRQDPQ